MKIKFIQIISLVLCLGLPAYAQTSKKSSQMHSRIHKEQLANVKSGMDKSVIADIIKNDVAAREDKNQLSKESENMLSDLLKEAHKHIGKPYSHGSKGPRAFDCSGFSSYVYKQFGITLNPASRAQFTQGETVKRTELRKGDLVFFSSRRSGKNVGHVGIVVSADESGNFKFIHASLGKGITVDNSTGYYANRYIGAKRIITK